MHELIEKAIPNVLDKLPTFFKSLLDTVVMVGWSAVFSFTIGAVLGIILIVCKKGGLYQNNFLYQVVDKLVNLFRSIPFIILMACLMDLTRAIMGTAIGVRGAIIPLIFGTAPFYSRQIESALSEVDSGLIEAAQSMGDTPMRIIFRVYLRESLPSIVRGTTITIISLIGLTSMAGVVGAGGIGDFAIRYGYNRHQTDVIYVSVIAIVIMVFLVQMLGSVIIKHLKK